MPVLEFVFWCKKERWHRSAVQAPERPWFRRKRQWWGQGDPQHRKVHESAASKILFLQGCWSSGCRHWALLLGWSTQSPPEITRPPATSSQLCTWREQKKWGLRESQLSWWCGCIISFSVEVCRGGLRPAFRTICSWRGRSTPFRRCLWMRWGREWRVPVRWYRPRRWENWWSRGRSIWCVCESWILPTLWKLKIWGLQIKNQILLLILTI